MHIFSPHDPAICSLDRNRLNHWLDNYQRLNEGLVMDQFDLEDLQRLVLLERQGKNRRPLLRRLVGRIISAERRRLWKAVLGEEAP